LIYSGFDMEVQAKSTREGTGNTGEIRSTLVSPWFISLNTQLETAVVPEMVRKVPFVVCLLE
jgi:hypothetical protein